MDWQLPPYENEDTVRESMVDMLDCRRVRPSSRLAAARAAIPSVSPGASMTGRLHMQDLCPECCAPA
jgi:hypothetical protein